MNFDYIDYEFNYGEYGSGVVPTEEEGEEYDQEVVEEHTMIAVSWDSCCSKVTHSIDFHPYLSLLGCLLIFWSN